MEPNVTPVNESAQKTPKSPWSIPMVIAAVVVGGFMMISPTKEVDAELEPAVVVDADQIPGFSEVEAEVNPDDIQSPEIETFEPADIPPTLERHKTVYPEKPMAVQHRLFSSDAKISEVVAYARNKGATITLTGDSILVWYWE